MSRCFGGAARLSTRAAICLLIGAGLSRASAQDATSPVPFLLDQSGAGQAHPLQSIPRPHAARLRISGRRGGSVPSGARVNAADTVTAPGTVTVAVFGDVFASAVMRGLGDIYADEPGVKLIDATREGASLTKDPVVSWSALLAATLGRGGSLDLAVVMVGSGDAVSIDAQPPGSAGWQAAYGDRVEQVSALFRDRHVPLIWVGMPIVRDEDMASRFAEQNGILRDRAAKAGGHFVDSWDGFVDESGDYAAVGPDQTGQPARLRRNDGTGFTRAGALKLAGFVDTELKPERARLEASRRLATMPIEEPGIFDQALQIDVNAQIRREAGLPASDLIPAKDGPVVTLTLPPTAANGVLATNDDPPIVNAALTAGTTPAPKPGRMDDFSWPKQ